MIGNEFTVTVTVSLAKHPLTSVPSTIKSVVIVGKAIGFGITESVNNTPGCHS